MGSRLGRPQGAIIFIEDRKILVPFDKREFICLKEAAGIAGKSESTRWPTTDA